MQENNDILQILFSYQDKNYAQFVQKLLPKNIDRENIKISVYVYHNCEKLLKT